jgi:hypothetical protein
MSRFSERLASAISKNRARVFNIEQVNPFAP